MWKINMEEVKKKKILGLTPTISSLELFQTYSISNPLYYAFPTVSSFLDWNQKSDRREKGKMKKEGVGDYE